MSERDFPHVTWTSPGSAGSRERVLGTGAGDNPMDRALSQVVDRTVGARHYGKDFCWEWQEKWL